MASREVTGVIDKVSEKGWKNKTLYSFVVDDVWYRTGEADPTEFEKAKVTFVFKKDRNGNKVVDVDDIEVVEEAPEDKPSQSSAKQDGLYTQYVGSGDKANYWLNREARELDGNFQYNYRAAMMAAMEYTRLLHDMGLFPKSGKNKPTLETIDALIEDKAAELYREYMDVQGLRAIVAGGDLDRSARNAVEEDPYADEGGDD